MPNWNKIKTQSIVDLDSIKDETNVKISTRITFFSPVFAERSPIIYNISTNYYCSLDLEKNNLKKEDSSKIAKDLLKATNSQECIVVGGIFNPIKHSIEVSYLKTKNLELKDNQISRI